jgi:hypothetical protein
MFQLFRARKVRLTWIEATAFGARSTVTGLLHAM